MPVIRKSRQKKFVNKKFLRGGEIFVFIPFTFWDIVPKVSGIKNSFQGERTIQVERTMELGPDV